MNLGQLVHKTGFVQRGVVGTVDDSNMYVLNQILYLKKRHSTLEVTALVTATLLSTTSEAVSIVVEAKEGVASFELPLPLLAGSWEDCLS